MKEQTYKGYTARQWAVLILRDDFNMNIRQISEIMGIHDNTVRYILNLKK